MSKTKPEDQKPLKNMHGDIEPDNIPVITILTPEPGDVLTGTSFDISGTATECNYVSVTVYDGTTGKIMDTDAGKEKATATVPVDANTRFFTCTMNITSPSSNACISITTLPPPSTSILLTGLAINQTNSSVVPFVQPIKTNIALTIGVDNSSGKDYLQCIVDNKRTGPPNNNDAFLLRFIQIKNNSKKKLSAHVHENNSSPTNKHPVTTTHEVKKNEIYIAHVIYSDDSNVFCSYAAFQVQ